MTGVSWIKDMELKSSGLSCPKMGHNGSGLCVRWGKVSQNYRLKNNNNKYKPNIKLCQIPQQSKTDVITRFIMNTVYFQPPGIKPQYCEVGMISETDPEYIWYLDEPCKILISEVKIIPKENVTYDKKSRLIMVRQNEL